MHTQAKDEVQFAVTLTPATTKAEKKNKDTNGGTTERILRDISYPKMWVIEGVRWDVAWHICIFEELIGAPCDESSGQWLGITLCPRANHG